MYKHYIFIRYNLDMYTDNVYNVEDKDSWMKHRLPLFKRLVESLRQQTNQNFTALVGVDDNTPDKYIEQIYRVIKDYDNIKLINKYHPIWIKEQEIKEDWLITSRIDNDDEYFPEFIETIQNEFRKITEVLDTRGMQCKNNKYYTVVRHQANSPFITLIEKTKNIKTVFYREHTNMGHKFRGRFVGDKALYIQHIHDRNVINKLSGEPINEK